MILWHYQQYETTLSGCAIDRTPNALKTKIAKLIHNHGSITQTIVAKRLSYCSNVKERETQIMELLDIGAVRYETGVTQVTLVWTGNVDLKEI